MKLIVEKSDLAWLHKNGFIGLEHIGILWEQLAQKCTIVTEGQSNLNNNRNALEIPNVEGIFLGEEKQNDICIAFSLENGEQLARSLQKRLYRKHKKVVLASSNGKFDPNEMEKRIASSSALIVLLTSNCLRQPEVVFAMLVAKFYYDHPSLVILVHDAESCFFPGYDEQPESVKEFFSEKAITYLNCYPNEGVKEIVTKFDEEVRVLQNITDNYKQKPEDAMLQILSKHESRKEMPIWELRKRMELYMTKEQLDEFENMADQNQNGTLDAEELQQVLDQLKKKAANKTTQQQQMEENKEDEEEHDESEDKEEDLTTRVFLSHKRSTGQGIAGRLYEGLKSSYSVFIDSEAKFKIHNLRLIVKYTDVFVFILSYGILLSKWCLEELKSAIDYKKRIIIVRELSYKLPDVLPDEWKSVEHVLRNSQELIWLAEYNSACINALQLFIGSTDEELKETEQHFAHYTHKKLLLEILEKCEKTGILDINKEFKLTPPTFSVESILDVVCKTIPAEKIQAIHSVRACENKMGVLPYSVVARLPNLEELDLFGYNISELTMETLTNISSMRKLHLANCNLQMDNVMQYLTNLDEIRYLYIESDLTDADVEQLVSRLNSLETLRIPLSNVTANIFNILRKMPNLLEVQLPFMFADYEETAKFAQDHPTIKVNTEPILVDCRDDHQRTMDCFMPTIVVSIRDKHPRVSLNVHWYGGTLRELIGEEQSTLYPLGTKSKAYGNLQYSEPKYCPLCRHADAMLQNVIFKEGKPNVRLANWNQGAGREVMEDFKEQVSKGVIEVPKRVHPGGLHAWAEFAKSLGEVSDLQNVHTLEWKIDQKELLLFIRYLPGLKKIVFTGPNEDDEVQEEIEPDSEFSSFLEVDKIQPVFPHIEELVLKGVFGCDLAEFASMFPNLKTLRVNGSGYETYEEDNFVDLFVEENQLEFLSIRECGWLTRKCVEKISDTCKNVTVLEFCQNSIQKRIVNTIASSFPNLKKLYADPIVVKSKKLAKLRPDVSVLPGDHLFDYRTVAADQWYPAKRISEELLTSEEDDSIRRRVEIHIYGFHKEDGEPIFSSAYPDEEKFIGRMVPVLTHAHEYGPFQKNPAMCDHCFEMYPLVADVKFGGQPNVHLIEQNEWHLIDSGKEVLKSLEPQQNNTLVVDEELRPGYISWWSIFKELAKTLDLQQKYTVKILGSYSAFDMKKAIKQIPICGLEFPREDPNFNDIMLNAICKNLPHLTKLVLPFCWNLSQEEWCLLNLPELEHLDLRWSNLTDDGISGIAMCTKLKYLNLRGSDITDAAIEKMSPNWGNLKALNLRKTEMTESTPQILAKNCPELESLNLVLCNIPSSACQLIAEAFPKLKNLKIPSHWVNTADLELLKQARPDLVIDGTSGFIDILQNEQWRPAVLTDETSPTERSFHIYANGVDSSFEVVGTQKAQFLTHAADYVSPFTIVHSKHTLEDCKFCKMADPYLENIKFAGKHNLRIEYQALLKNILHDVNTTGKLDLGRKRDRTLRWDMLLNAVMKRLDFEAVTEIVFRSPTYENGILERIAKFPNVKTISLFGKFTDAHVTYIANSGWQLKSLSLFFCEFTAQGYHKLGEQFGSLEHLSIKTCKTITDESLECIVKNNLELQNIEIDFLYKLTARSVSVLQHLPRLTNLKATFKNSQKQVNDEIAKLIQNHPQIQFTRGDRWVEVVYEYPIPAFVAEDNKGLLTLHPFGGGQDPEDQLESRHTDVEEVYNSIDKYKKPKQLPCCEHCSELYYLACGFEIEYQFSDPE